MRRAPRRTRGSKLGSGRFAIAAVGPPATGDPTGPVAPGVVPGPDMARSIGPARETASPDRGSGGLALARRRRRLGDGGPAAARAGLCRRRCRHPWHSWCAGTRHCFAGPAGLPFGIFRRGWRLTGRRLALGWRALIRRGESACASAPGLRKPGAQKERRRQQDGDVARAAWALFDGGCLRSDAVLRETLRRAGCDHFRRREAGTRGRKNSTGWAAVGAENS